MAWFGETFGDGLSSLKGQITKITKDVLSEDPLAVTSYEGRIQELENELKLLRTGSCECDSLKSKLGKLQEEYNALNVAIEGLDLEHEKGMQIIIEERDHLKSILNERPNLNSEKEGVDLNITKQQREIDKLRINYDVKQKEVLQLSQDNAKLKRELAAMSTELASNQEILNDFNDRLEDSENEAKKLYEQLQIQEETRMKNTPGLRRDEKQDNDSEVQLEQAQSIIEELMNEAATANDIKMAFDALTIDNEQLKERVAKLEMVERNSDQIHGNCQHDLETLSRDLVELKQQLKCKTEEVDSLQQQLKEETGKNSALSHDISTITSQLAEKENVVSDVKTIRNSLEKKILDLGNYLAIKENEISLATATITELKKYSDNYQQQISDFEMKNDNANLIIAELHEQLQEMNLKNATLEEENSCIKDRSNDIQEETTVLGEEHFLAESNILNSPLDGKEKEISAIRKELENAITSKQIAEEEFSRKISELKDAQVEKDKAIDLLTQELNSANASIATADQLHITEKNQHEAACVKMSGEIKSLLKKLESANDATLMMEEKLSRDSSELKNAYVAKEKEVDKLVEDLGSALEAKQLAEEQYFSDTNALKARISHHEKTIEELSDKLENASCEMNTKRNEETLELEDINENDSMVNISTTMQNACVNLENQLILKIKEIDELNERLKMAQLTNNDLVQESESLQIKYDVIKHNLIAAEDQRNNLLQQIASLNAQYEANKKELINENNTLNIKLNECTNTLEASNRENKELKDKLDKLGFGVVAGDFIAQFKKLQQLASRMNPNLLTQTDQDDAYGQQSQTDDVKRLKQDLSNITTNIRIIENGVNTLESNVNQWDAAVQARDQIIQTQQLQIAEIEGEKDSLIKNSEELKRQVEEWESRYRELQTLYESEVGRLEKLYDKGLNIDQPDENEIIDETNSPNDLNDKVARLVNENADLKVLVQQLRGSMLQTNLTAPTQLTAPPSQLSNVSAGISDAKYHSLKEKESSLSKEVERLREHLAEVEEHYTTEAVNNQEELRELRKKLATAEEQLRSSTTVYKSANVRSTQHVEALNSQLQLITVQRNDLQAKLSEAEDNAQKQAAALMSLQVVLEQFQIDKQRELSAAEERNKYMNDLEKRRVAEMEEEVMSLKKQLADANNGLKAALRLGEQLDYKTRLLADKENELVEVRQRLQSLQQEVSTMTQATAGKIDKHLIKNLVIGFLAAHGEQKTQAMRILTAVLELNEEEKSRAGLKTGDGGWLSNILHPSPSNSSAVSTESLSQAFVRFLENESRPQPQLRLLPEESQSKSSGENAKRSPLVLSELVLPTVSPTPVSDSVISGVFKDS